MAKALTMLCERAEEAVHGGYNIIILSDRMQVGPDRIPFRRCWRRRRCTTT
jgi:glutamate synthase (NADPH/NADH) large chain